MNLQNHELEDGQPAAIDYNWTAPISDEEFNHFRTIAHREAGIWIAEFKRNMVFRRVSKRVRALGLNTIADYCEYLDDADNWHSERQPLINALTTNKTSFFREDHHFRFLEGEELPRLVSETRGNASKRLRIWSAGCSSGEEAYSIAMTLYKCIDKLSEWDARILATDIDTEMVDHGRQAIYINEFLDDIPEEYRKKYASPVDGNRFRLAFPLKKLITFKALNLLGPWPMKGPFDMIFCRNVVIYFDKPTKQELFDRFADILKPDGLLFIGHSESLFKVTKRFRMVGQSVYQRIE